MPTLPRDTLPHHLAARLPAPPARVLVWGVGASEVAAGLAALGYAARPEASGDAAGPGHGAGRPAPPEAPVAAAVVLAAAVPAAADLAALRRALTPAGHLLMAAGADREGARRLAEAGFVVLEEGVSPAAGDGPRALIARRDEHRIRPAGEADAEAILALFRRAFHVDRSLEYWRWKYRRSPWGEGPISVAVGPGGELAAHYAGYPLRFVASGDGAPHTLCCLHIGDTMTAPEARSLGRGATNLLTRTVRHFYAAWCEGRVAFNFGVNTGKIQRFSRRTAGARRLEDVPYRVRSLDGLRLPAPERWRSRLGGWRVERVAAFDERWDELFQRVAADYGLLVERSSRYLAWRYLERPDADYLVLAVHRRRRLAGWGVFRREGERLVWGDALFDPRLPGAPRHLLARLPGLPETAGCRTVEGWLTERPAWWGRAVAGLGFEARPEPEDLGIVYVPFEVDPGDDLARRLYYTKGDSDLF
jgi:hypothetical protein